MRHPRWYLHFIPTHSSWLNQVERFFATNRRLRRGVFGSIAQLRAAIISYIDARNQALNLFAGPPPLRPSLERSATYVTNFDDRTLDFTPFGQAISGHQEGIAELDRIGDPIIHSLSTKASGSPNR